MWGESSPFVGGVPTVCRWYRGVTGEGDRREDYTALPGHPDPASVAMIDEDDSVGPAVDPVQLASSRVDVPVPGHADGLPGEEEQEEHGGGPEESACLGPGVQGLHPR